MYVKDHMTKNPYTIKKDTSVSKALDIMQQHRFHRLPVVDDEGKLIGLVTAGLISEGSGANITSLDIYELNYLLSKTKVDGLMIRDVKKIGPEELLEAAAQSMLDNGVNVLPVVDDDNKVVGIITEKDIFQTFVDLLGYKHQGTRFVLACKDRPGEFAHASKLFADADANLESLAVYHTAERGTEVVVKATGEISVEDMTKILKDAGYEIHDIVQTTKIGTTVRYPVE
ncbi:MAG: CBS domain-containing protein [Solobacterium sp.]|nr:CBS domain-containing protein [Solobacterium sp.]